MTSDGSAEAEPRKTSATPMEALLRPAARGDDHLVLRLLGQFGTLSASSTLVALIGDVIGTNTAQTAAIGLIVLVALYAIVYREFVNRHVKAYWAVLVMCGFFVGVVVSSQYMTNKAESGLSKTTGIVKYTPRANDFLPELKTYIDGAQEEIWLTGVSFYLTLPQHRDSLLAALRRGVDVRILIYNPMSPNLQEIAEGFSQTPEELTSESDVTIANLKSLQAAWQRNPTSTAHLEVRLFSTVPRARLYIFDRRREDGYTYFIPHVDHRNTPNLPGFLIRNIKTGIGPPYFEGVDRVWQRSITLDDYLKTREEAQRAAAASAPARSEKQKGAAFPPRP